MIGGFIRKERFVDEWIAGGETYRLVDVRAGPKQLRVLRDGLWKNESDCYVHGVLCNRIEHYAGGHSKKIQRKSDDLLGLAHELWATAQLLPGEGIEDGAERIAELLKSNAQVESLERSENA